MNLLRRLLAMLLLPALCLLVFAFLLGSALNETLLRGVFLKNELRKVDAYNVAVGEFTRLVNTTGQSKNKPQKESFNIASLGLAPVIQAVVTAEWLQQVAEQNLDHLDRWLNRNKPLVLRADISDRKPILQEKLRLWLEQKITSLPKCPLLEFQRRLQAVKNINGLCTPPGFTADTLLKELKKSGIDPNVLIATLPDEIDLLQPQASLQPFFEKLGQSSSPPPDQLAKISDQLERIRQNVQTARRYLFLAFIAILVLVAVEILLMAQGKKAVVRWMAVLSSATAVLPLLVGVVGYLASRTVIPAQLPLENLSAEVRTALVTLAQNVVAAVFLPLIIYGVLAIVISIVLRITSKFLKDEKRERQPANLKAR